MNAAYDDIQVLWDISFEVEQGEIVAIVGGNGAGKTTTVKSISGMMKPISGSINYDGVELSGKSCLNYIENGVVHIPEGRQLFRDMTVYENLEMGACSREAREKKLQSFKRIYEWFPKLEERRNQAAGTLSGGEQQMVAMARGMMGLPKVLMMDEPSLGLAPNIVDNILEITKDAANNGLAVILVEQDVRKALRIATRGYVLENGSVTIRGTAEELLNNEEIKKAYLGF
ncbi:MAG: ABC transporter ATP-binding protein [Oscillospiraceae bacterium]